MMVNPDVDGYTKTLNHRKNAKHINLLKTKRILKPKYKLNEVRFLHLACHCGDLSLCYAFSYASGCDMHLPSEAPK